MAHPTANRNQTSRPDTGRSRAAVRAQVDSYSTCCCGQPLDARGAGCCPRCGVSLAANRPRTPSACGPAGRGIGR